MKVLVVLALAVFTSCHANLLYADDPKPQIDVLAEVFWEYYSKAIQTADAVAYTIWKSQVAQEVQIHLGRWEEQLPPEAFDLMNKFSAKARALRRRLGRQLHTVSEGMSPYVISIAFSVQQRLDQLKEELAPYAESVDVEALKTLLQKGEMLMGFAVEVVTELYVQLQPYTEGLKQGTDQHLQDLKENVAPRFQKVQVEMFTRALQLQDLLAPYAEDLSERMDPYAEDLKTWLGSLYLYLGTLYQSFMTDN